MTFQDIKHKFFAYRNGVVADTLRRSGMPYKMIFGVDVATLRQIALECGPNQELAESLWDDRDTRESRLLAPQLMDPRCVGIDKTFDICLDVRTREEADILTFRLLRHLPYARQLLEKLESEQGYNMAAQSLRRHLG